MVESYDSGPSPKIPCIDHFLIQKWLKKQVREYIMKESISEYSSQF